MQRQLYCAALHPPPAVSAEPDGFRHNANDYSCGCEGHLTAAGYRRPSPPPPPLSPTSLPSSSLPPVGTSMRPDSPPPGAAATIVTHWYPQHPQRSSRFLPHHSEYASVCTPYTLRLRWYGELQGVVRQGSRTGSDTGMSMAARACAWGVVTYTTSPRQEVMACFTIESTSSWLNTSSA
jgi:hypothetical protein